MVAYVLTKWNCSARFGSLPSRGICTTSDHYLDRDTILTQDVRGSHSPKDSPMPEFPMKEWSVKLYLLDQEGNKRTANCFQKVTYNLHPSFEEPQQSALDHDRRMGCEKV